MSNKLFKIPSEATTGRPGSPARPAYCEMQAIRETTGIVPIYEIISMTAMDGPTLEDPNRPVRGIVERRLVGYTAGTTTVRYVERCYPEIPAVIGIPGSPATQSPGWSGGARTIPFIAGNGAFRFHINPAVVGAVVGIGGSPDPAFSFNVVTHGFYASRGSYAIMESGNQVFGSSSNTAGQEFAVNVVGTTVQYLVDGSVVHTSVAPRSGIAFPTAVLYLAGDSVDNASITAAISAPASASMELLPMVGTGLMRAAFNQPPFTAHAVFENLTSTVEVGDTFTGAASFEAMAASGSMGLSVLGFTASGWFNPMASLGGGASPALAEGHFQAMAASGIMPSRPMLSLTAVGRFQSMTSEGNGRTPVSASGSFHAMTSIGSDRPVAIASSVFPAMTGSGEMNVPEPAFAAATGTFAAPLSFGVLPEMSPVFYSPLTALGDINAAWMPAEWDGTTVHIVSGSGAGQSAAVVGNNGHVLWLESGGGWSPVPEGGSGYEIRDTEGLVLYKGLASAPSGPQTMRPMAAMSSEGVYSESRVVMAPMTGAAFHFLALDGVAEITIGKPFSLWAWAYQGMPVRFSGVMPKPLLAGYSGAAARMRSVAPGLLAEGSVDVVGRAKLTGTSPMLHSSGVIMDRGKSRMLAPSAAILAFSGAVAPIKTLAPSLVATGSMMTVGLASTRSPRGKLTAFGGAVSRIKATAPSLLASGTVMDTGRSRMQSGRPFVVGFSGAVSTTTAPSVSLNAIGSTAIIAMASLSIKQAYTMRAFSGAVMTQRLSKPTLQAEGVKGIIGHSRVVMPAPKFEGSGRLSVFGRALLWMPAPSLRTGMNAAELVAPKFRLSALADAMESAQREAWAINLDASGDDGVFAATHYTQFPIRQIVEFAGSAYGITDTGLYRMEGATDDAAPIPWSVKTTPNDHGSIHLKRSIAAYLGGNLGPTAQVSVFVGEKSTESYSYANVRGPRLQNHRVQFGRGMVSRHYAYGVSDATGGELELQSLDVEITPIGRAI